MKKQLWNFVWLIFLFFAIGCKDAGINKQPEYDGPIAESYNLETQVSDSARIKLTIKGPRQLIFQNGDYEYPEGVYIEFYDKEGNIISTIKANRGFFDNQAGQYKVEEDVEVINFNNDRKLNTEELYWDPRKEEVYTDKFVNITTATKIIKGVGLVAAQDFSDYQIGKITGELYMNDDF